MQHLIDAARVGFAGLPVSPSVQETALDRLTQWLESPRLAAYSAQIVGLIQAQAWSTLLDSFYQDLPFGTGGRRGPVGIGPNRFNPITLTAVVQGHVNWLLERYPGAAMSVVIGYDVRGFHDLASALLPEFPTPVHGITSRAFAEIAAEVYASADITVFLPPTDGVLSTPELSFAVRALEAHAGLVITASHNPPDDNGSKFYHAHGGQMVPPHDDALAAHVRQIERVERLSLDRARATGMIREIPDSVHAGYIEANLRCGRKPEARSASVVFTPLHGTGLNTVLPVLQAAGFEVTVEPSQAELDGRFPTVPFRAPNPERPATMDIARQTADQLGADLVMSCDPDADRLGVAVRHPISDGGWRVLTGNEIAALVCHAALIDNAESTPIILRTEVTSSLVSRIGEAGGAQVVDHLLVGFKYIGEAMDLLERKGRFGSLNASLDAFCAGVEESHGVLVSTAVRDKDAAGGALLLAELASMEKDQGRTLVDTLHTLWTAHGYVHNELLSTAMPGAEGRARIAAIQASFRDRPPDRIGALSVLAMHDRQDESGPFGPIQCDSDRASRNVLVFELEAGARLILRPSGTEPKNKLYVEVVGQPDADLETEIPRVKAIAQALGEAMVLQMLDRIGIKLPAWALHISDLVTLEHKEHFVHQVLPSLEARLAAPAPDDGIGVWLDEALSPIGPDARVLIGPGIAAYVQAGSPVNSNALLACFSQPG